MSKKLKRCVRKVKKQGNKESSAYAICNASINEGVSKRRSFPNAEYTNDIVYILTRYLGFVRQPQGSTSHIKFTRDLDGTTVGLKLARGNMVMKGDPWKKVLESVFWWAAPGDREGLWTKARESRGKDHSIMPKEKRSTDTMHGAQPKLPSFKSFFHNNKDRKRNK